MGFPRSLLKRIARWFRPWLPAAVAQVRKIPGRRAGRQGRQGRFEAGRRVPSGRDTAADHPETLCGYRPSAASEGHPATCGTKARRCCYICSAPGRKADLDAGLGRTDPPGSDPRKRRDRRAAGAPATAATSRPCRATASCTIRRYRRCSGAPKRASVSLRRMLPWEERREIENFDLRNYV